MSLLDRPNNTLQGSDNPFPSGQLQTNPPPPPPKQPRQFGWRDFVVLIVALVFLDEQFASEDHKISTLLGGFEGHKEAVALRTKLAETQATIAAQKDEEVRMQQEVENYRAHMERVTEAYKMTYQKAILIAQAAAQMQQQSAQLQQQFAKEGVAGKNASAMVLDIIGAFQMAIGEQESAKKTFDQSKTLRAMGQEELATQTQATVQNVQASLDKLLAGLPNPADVLGEDRAAPLKPAPRLPPPAKPKRYQPPTQAAAGARLATVNNLNGAVFVRSEPNKASNNGLCTLSPGQIVALVADSNGGQSLDPASGINFVHVRFNRQGYGETNGWVSAKVLNDYSGTAAEAETPQYCKPPEPAKG